MQNARQHFSVRQHILYGTLTRGAYRDISQLLAEENNNTLGGVALITTVFGAACSVLSLAGVLSRHVLPAYVFLLCSSIVFLVVRKFVTSASYRASYVVCLLQALQMLVFGILNSAVFAPSPDSNGTIFVVLLIVIPFVFTDIPCRMFPFLVAVSACYCVCIRRFKAPSVVSLDTVNTVFVCLVSCMCNWIFAGRTMRDLSNRLYIEKERDTDALTGLLTKQSARVITIQELSHGASGVFVIVDLDDFKNVNDTYGHLYGDRVLSLVASCIHQNTRRTDVAARFGGDEFTIFFPNMDISIAERKISDLYASIEKAFADEQTRITCSVGIKAVSPGMEYDAVFNAADEALYNSKRDGKNRFSISGGTTA